MDNLYFFKRILFAILLVLLNFPAHAGKGDYGGVWSDTLNFSCGVIRTGATGTVRQIDGTPFDIDNYHRTALKERAEKVRRVTGQDPNVVVASLTVIMRCGDDFEVYSEFLKEEKKDFLAFVSGSVAGNFSPQREYDIIQASEKYKPLALLRTFEERFKRPSQPMSVADATSAVVTAAAAPSGPSTLPALGIREHKLPELQQQYTRWQDKQRSQLEDAKRSLGGLLAEDTDSVYSLSAKVHRVFKEVERRANSGFGSSVDSEQYLLSYLNQEKLVLASPPKRLIVYQLEKLLRSYKAEKLKHLRKKFSEKLQTEKTHEMRTAEEPRFSLTCFSRRYFHNN